MTTNKRDCCGRCKWEEKNPEVTNDVLGPAGKQDSGQAGKVATLGNAFARAHCREGLARTRGPGRQTKNVDPCPDLPRKATASPQPNHTRLKTRFTQTTFAW